ncbi:MAG TPA: dienelactone hydrolase family protein [Allosphingosinicella sp.]|nr:dienelactone hydrolase family protein [Allosphingosinicella sp.]
MDLAPISYEASGRSFAGWLADGSGGAPAPGVLVLHEGAGLTDVIRDKAARVAAEFGCVAFAPDLFGAPPPAPGDAAALAEAQAIVRGLRDDPAELRARCAAALAVLEGHPRVDPGRLAAIGYCFGGAAAIELARAGAPLKAVAGFHAGVLPGGAEAIGGRVLLCHGAEDPAVPAARIQEFAAALGEAGIDWQLHLYGGVGHSFTNPGIDAWNLPGFRYDARADARAWAALARLLGEVF